MARNRGTQVAHLYGIKLRIFSLIEWKMANRPSGRPANPGATGAIAASGNVLRTSYAIVNGRRHPYDQSGHAVRLALPPMVIEQPPAICTPRPLHQWVRLTSHKPVQQRNLKLAAFLTRVVRVGESDARLHQLNLLYLDFVGNQWAHDLHGIEKSDLH
ncbi:MAG TPA: hypothetical protein VMS18_23955 [Candidatus Binatia bacterium]|nr:hypothetical protein [Candidatus Binatia bacterium]